jgi:hypothetical protein
LSVLKPTELAVKELSKESSNLLTCEDVFKFLFDVLAKHGSELSEMMLEALRKLYNERRNKDLVLLLKYLQNPNMIQSEDDFKYSSKAAIINQGSHLSEKKYTDEMIKKNQFFN